MKKNIFPIIFIFLPLAGLSQTGVRQAGGIWGFVADSTNRALIPYAHITFITPKDSISIAADARGIFRTDRILDEPIRIRVSAIGYKPYKKIHIPSKEGYKLHIPMIRDTIPINEIVVSGKRIAIVMRGDTVRYNAAAFSGMEGDVFEQMVKKMPGITFKNGNLYFNGQPISRILVDGKNTFGNSKNVLENLKAAEIKHINIYDEAEEFEKKLGIKYPRKNKVMDVTTKRKAPIYSNAGIYAAIGKDIPRDNLSEIPILSRFKGKYDFFRADEQLTANFEQNSTPGDIPEQKKLLHSAVKYSDNTKKLKYATDNRFSYKKSYHNSLTEWDYFPTDKFTSRSMSKTSNHEKRNTDFYSINNFKYENWSGIVAYNYKNGRANQENTTISDIDKSIVSHTKINTHDKEDISGIRASILSYHSLTKTCILSTALSGNADFKSGKGWKLDTASGSIYPTNITGQTKTHQKDGVISFNFIRRFTSLLIGNFKISSLYNGNYAKNISEDLVTGNIDTANTWNYSRKNLESFIKSTISLKKSKYAISAGWKISITEHRLNLNFPNPESNKTVNCRMHPELHIDFFPTPIQNGRLEYFSESLIPLVEESVNIIDIRNPFNLKAGNNDLKIPISHTITAKYNFIIPQKSSSFTFWCMSRITKNHITYESLFFTEDTYLPEYNYTAARGASLQKSVNGGTHKSTRLSITFSKLLNSIATKIDMNIAYGYTHTPYSLDRKLLSLKLHSGKLNGRIITDFSNKTEISANTETAFNTGKSNEKRNRYIEENVQLKIRSDIVPKYRLSTKIAYTYKHSYDMKESDISQVFWDASVERKLKGQNSISLNAYNLLNVQKTTTWRISTEYTFFRKNYSPARYLLLTYTHIFK